jgi:glycine betaine/choline ABC-type transport system substrate-binding protein
MMNMMAIMMMMTMMVVVVVMVMYIAMVTPGVTMMMMTVNMVTSTMTMKTTLTKLEYQNVNHNDPDVAENFKTRRFVSNAERDGNVDNYNITNQ